ncbi:MAG: acetyl-CoA hydrolase/transferase C-terminal domain-containing protein [Saprospiraceae bacterium]|nr:acetyl-CoA hydrolase/transferase C-terminal domain-containing protein [Saprospiraceae bacterium]
MITSAETALDQVRSGDNVFIHTAAAAPQHLVQALAGRAKDISNINIYQLHTEGVAPYASDEYQDTFNIKAFFVGANIRHAIQTGRSSYIPIFLSECPGLFRKGVIPLDVALISVSPPDSHGMCSLGPSVDASLAALEAAKIVIAQINRNIPRAHGDGFIHKDRINYFVEHDQELVEVKPTEPDAEQKAIGNHIANLIEDGATLQMGIGAIPNAVLNSLEGHRDLGVHSEMFSDGIIPLVKKGVINGKNKVHFRGMIVGSFVIGSKRLYDFIDDNPLVKLIDSEYVNNTDVIRQNPKVTAINSAIEIDLTGQVCADSIGSKIYSGVGGQMDFIRGASLSEGGKPIIAMKSTTSSGQSKIVPYLTRGAGVVTTRAHVHYVVTEYGAVNLYGKTIKERAELLSDIAHPDFREDLRKKAFELWK